MTKVEKNVIKNKVFIFRKKHSKLQTSTQNLSNSTLPLQVFPNEFPG